MRSYDARHYRIRYPQRSRNVQVRAQRYARYAESDLRKNERKGLVPHGAGGNTENYGNKAEIRKYVKSRISQ